MPSHDYTQRLKGHLDLLLLALLQGGPLHGYAITERLRLLSANTFDLSDGTIYPALHRLEQAGLLTSWWSDETVRRRRLYALTAEGRATLADGRKEWQMFAQGVEAILFGGGTGS
jgi:PadR family transcriptional regulator, regulatory protein PadR